MLAILHRVPDSRLSASSSSPSSPSSSSSSSLPFLLLLLLLLLFCLSFSFRPYPIYWASSVNDWYWASGDTARFLELAPDMARIIDNAVNKFLQPGLNVAWSGGILPSESPFCFKPALAGGPVKASNLAIYLSPLFPLSSLSSLSFSRSRARVLSLPPSPSPKGKHTRRPFVIRDIWGAST